MTAAATSPMLHATRVRLLLSSPDQVPLPRFSGSAWRGAFGHALKRTVCVMRLRPCEGCPLLRSCAYPAFFAPGAGANDEAAERAPFAPAPFVLSPDETPRGGVFPPGQAIGVTLRLFGTGTRAAAYTLAALQRAAQEGIGPARRRLDLVALGAEDAAPQPPSARAFQEAVVSGPLPPPPPLPRAIRLRLPTPLRLRVQSDLVTPARFEPAHLLLALVRRVAALHRGDGGVELACDVAALKRAALGLAWTEHRWGWVETTRRSSRQQATLQMGGIVGDGLLDLAPAPELWPFLWAGQWLHAGKAATMGFGRIEIAPA